MGLGLDFCQDISMHTFDNGLKSTTKNDNWEQLFRLAAEQRGAVDGDGDGPRS